MTIWGWRLVLQKARRHQQQLEKVCTSETVMVARCCQYNKQPLSPAVSRGNNSYNTNSPSASVVTVIRKHSHTCVCATFTSHGYYSTAGFISFKSLIWIVWMDTAILYHMFWCPLVSSRTGPGRTACTVALGAEACSCMCVCMCVCVCVCVRGEG